MAETEVSKNLGKKLISRIFFRMPERVQEAMQMQVEAERKKRAAILESEGMNTYFRFRFTNLFFRENTEN